MKNILYYGDNLEILRKKIADDSIDLCYIDPPFNSKRSYFQIYNQISGEQDKAQAQAFTDTWTWDDDAIEGYEQIVTNFEGRYTRQVIELIKGLELILGKENLLAYLISMTLRITEIYRVLKPTGSFYLHCDPTASHYLKLVLDAVFCGQGGDFRNEIIWHYSGWNARLDNKFNSRHDVILFYAKEDSIRQVFNSYVIPWEDEKEYVKVRKQKVNIDENGQKYVLSDAGGGKRAKRYLHEAMAYGKPVDDVWAIDKINNSSKERLGYPTQKPEALLERIILASSNEGDLVLDAYCGCGTTVAVAQRLNRRWIGIDITYHSIALILKRMEDTFGKGVLETIKVDGIPQDVNSARALAERKDDRTRKEFEKWAVLTYTNNRAAINTKKGADQGIDGIVYFAATSTTTERMVIQVKSGGANRGTIAALHGDMEREKAQMATLITIDDPTKPMREEASKAGLYFHELMGKSYDRIQIVTIREIIEQGKRLDLPMTFETVKTAKKQDDSGTQLTIDL